MLQVARFLDSVEFKDDVGLGSFLQILLPLLCNSPPTDL